MDIVLLLSKRCPVHRAEKVGSIIKDVDRHRSLGLLTESQAIDLAKDLLQKIATVGHESSSNRTYCTECDMGGL
jgi:hypothetical protein